MVPLLRTSVLALAVSLSAAAGEEYPRGPVPKAGEVFRASFEGGQRADAGAGFLDMGYAGTFWSVQDWKFVFGEGRVGKGLDLRLDSLSPADKKKARGVQMACFKAQGHVCSAVGALSFWVRRTKEDFQVALSSQSNDSWNPLPLVQVFTGKGNRLEVVVGHRDYSRLSQRLNARVEPGAWHHVAVAWDEALGVRLHLDGKEVFSDWGKGAYQTGYLSAGRLSLTGEEFDEVRVFDFALTPAQVEALAQGRPDALTPGPPAALPPEHALDRLSWRDAPPGHFIPADGPTSIRRVDMDDARALLISGWRAVDGRQDSVWPLHYHGYQFMGGGGLHLTPAAGSRFNHVRVTGPIDEAALCEGKAWTRPDGARVLAELKGGRFVTTFRLDPPCSASSVSVYPAKERAHYQSSHRQLHDLALLDVQPAARPNDPQVGLFAITGQPPDTVAGDNRIRLIQWYRPEDRRVVMARPGAAGGGVPVAAFESLHVMLPSQDQDLPLSAVRLNLRADGWPRGARVNLRLHDPFNLWRELADVDVELARPGELDVTLAFPATIIPAGVELWLTLVSDQPGALAPGSSVAVHGPPMEKAQESYLAWQHRLLKDTFASLSEPRPWYANDLDDTFLRVALTPYDAISRLVWDLHRRFPTDRWTRGYMLYTHPQSKEYWKSLPIDLPQDPRAPRWALLQKELLKEFLFFVNWWIDNRQAPNGELGNWWGDDTDLVSDWLDLALIHDPDGKFRRSQRLVADHCWNNMMKNGLNTRFTDSLHAYEDGLNVQVWAAQFDYGNPVLWERLQATCRRYDGFLLTPAEGGKRTFRGDSYSDAKIENRGDASRMGAMGLSLHAGLTSMWYNGNPTLVKMLTELHDGLKDVRDYVLGLPHGLYDQTGDRRFLSRPEAAFTNAAWAALLNPKDCPAETLKGLVEHQYELGSTTSLGSGNYRPLIKYLAWRHTGDKSHLVPALEYLWKQCYYTNYLFTKTEQSGDRVHAHKALTDFMYLGGVAGARNLTYPYLAVSYEGFSPDFAGLVEEHTSETLRWVGFSFEDAPRSGRLRVWRLAPGGYEVRMGPDEDGDGRMDREDRKLTLDLKRYETIPVTLPGRTLYLVEVRQVRKDTPLYERCDLAVTHEDATRQGTGLTVVVHNLGCRATGAFAVELADANGRVLATQRHDGLDGVADLQDKTAKITFENAPAQGPLTVAVRGSVPEITEVNNRAVIPAP